MKLSSIAQNTYFELATEMEAIASSDDGVKPHLKIIVEPIDKFRFRYKSETDKGSHGNLPGCNPAAKNSKTNFPTVKLYNWNESCDNIQIKASVYTSDHNPHVLEFVGKNCTNGTCTESLSAENKTAIFQFLKIENKCRKVAIDILMKRQIDLCEDIYYEEEIRKQATEEFKQINMNCAIICFEALHNNIPICQVFSRPIKDLKKSTPDLKITRISSYTGSCRGGDEIILLCDTVNRKDVEIHFYENDEKIGMGTLVDVHKHVAIVFKTPKYRNNVGAMVQMKLFRPSDEQSSEPRSFTYIPDDIGTMRHSKKRKISSIESFELLDINQPSTSRVQEPELLSSSTNSSVLEASANFLGSPGTSSLEEELAQLSDEEFEQLYNSIDLSNLIQFLKPDVPDSSDPFTDEDYGSEVEMEAATALDLYPSETEDQFSNFGEYKELFDQSIFLPKSAIGEDKTMLTYVDTEGHQEPYGSDSGPQDRGCSGGPGIFEALVYLASEGSSSLWNATIGRAVSYVRPSPSNNKSDAKTPSHKCVAQSEMADPSIRAPQPSDDTIYAQSAVIVSMENLSIQEDKKRVVKIVDKTHANSYDVKDTRNVEDTNKESEINKNFKSYKEAVTEIMKRRGKDLRYISGLISVKDENGNSFIHLAVMELSENWNLLARILKIAPPIVNEQNRFQETPLHLATQKNAWKMAFQLLAQGGNPSIVDVNGNNCFHIASQSNYAKSMLILLFHSLKKGKHIPSIDDFNYDGFSPLHLSVVNNAKECMQLLLKAGADVNINDRRSGSSPLHLAIKQQPSIAYDLLSHPDIDLTNTDFNGHSILHSLCVMKGTPMPVIDKFTGLVDWARKTLALPSQDFEESSSSDSSSNSDSDEEVDNQDKTIDSSYSGNFHSQEINEVENENFWSEECEKRLCKCLDVDGRWRKFGLLIGIDEKTLNGGLKLSKNSSPSRLVLNKFKEQRKNYDKTTLMNFLTEADLENVAEILRNEIF